MSNDELSHQIRKRLLSAHPNDRIDAVTELPKLQRQEALSLIDWILDRPGEIGMKIEALRLLPIIITSSRHTLGTQIINKAINIDEYYAKTNKHTPVFVDVKDQYSPSDFDQQWSYWRL